MLLRCYCVGKTRFYLRLVSPVRIVVDSFDVRVGVKKFGTSIS